MLSFKKLIYCSNWGPMPEFGEDGVIYFDPHNIDDLKDKILKMNSKQ